MCVGQFAISRRVRGGQIASISERLRRGADGSKMHKQQFDMMKLVLLLTLVSLVHGFQFASLNKIGKIQSLVSKSRNFCTNRNSKSTLIDGLLSLCALPTHVSQKSSEYFPPVIVKVDDQPVMRVVAPNDWDESSRGSGSSRDIVINPGFAWGEGTHPSTYMCLQFVCEKISGQSKKLSVLDYGTGSGVLAIAARHRGGGRIVGVDKDDEILQCATDNANLNFDEGGGIEFHHGRDVVTGSKGVYLGVSSASATFDLVVANMLPAALVRMASTIASAVKGDEGVLALCGMRRDQVQDVKAAYEKNGVSFISERSMEGSAPGAAWAEWVLLEARVPVRSADESLARLDYLSDAAIG